MPIKSVALNHELPKHATMSTQRPAKRLKIEVQILTKPRKTIVHEKAHKANTLESKNDEDDDDVVIIDPPPKNEHKSSKSYSINGSRTQIPPLRAEPVSDLHV